MSKRIRQAIYRAKMLRRARRVGHQDGTLTSAEHGRIVKWRDLLVKARRGMPLRERAWIEMQALIDEKVVEQGGNNRGRRVEQIIRANGGVPGEPWCGDTVAYVYLRAGAKSVVRSWASVWGGLERLLAKVLRPKIGHVVIYNFGSGHTGLFKEWAKGRPGYFWAGEGNTGDSGAASDSATGGDGVKLKLRHKSQVKSWRRVRR